MSHIIQIPVPDEWYDRLTAYAERHGQSPETLLLALAEATIQQEKYVPAAIAALPEDDPMRRLAGIINIPVERGWADDHDRYIDGETDHDNIS